MHNSHLSARVSWQPSTPLERSGLCLTNTKFGFAQRFLANGWGRVWNGTKIKRELEYENENKAEKAVALSVWQREEQLFSYLSKAQSAGFFLRADKFGSRKSSQPRSPGRDPKLKSWKGWFWTDSKTHKPILFEIQVLTQKLWLPNHTQTCPIRYFVILLNNWIGMKWVRQFLILRYYNTKVHSGHIFYSHSCS